jgi:glycosyltransferase involved in cell wall biosynthesis
MILITIWMNMPSFYQGDLFRALVATGKVDLQVIFAHELSEDRRQLGWDSDLSGFEYSFLDPNQAIRDAMGKAIAQRSRFHVVNGIWAEPGFAAALTALMSSGSGYAIYSEAPNPNKLRSKQRKLAQHMFGRMVVAKSAGLLPVSHLASDFFRDLGAPEEKLYPFGYFRSTPRFDGNNNGFKARSTIEVVFVGQLVRRKGVDILLDAIGPLFTDYPNLILTIIGDGPERSQLEQQAAPISSRITFAGKMSPPEIPGRLAAADVLVLPSRWDGWGLVVNEALSAGVPVIVSDQCGAAEVIHNGMNGYVVLNEDREGFRGSLRRCFDPKERATLRSAAKVSSKSISTEAVAPYLIQSLEHMLDGSSFRPSPPWANVERAPVLWSHANIRN